jgi:tRNA U54 and U55 pseudouridine synthase Pus10
MHRDVGFLVNYIHGSKMSWRNPNIGVTRKFESNDIFFIWRQLYIMGGKDMSFHSNFREMPMFGFPH